MYDKLLASKHPNVQDSLNSWLPPNSGLREKIEDISRRHPNGFGSGEKGVTEGTELMDEMENRLRRVSNAITRCMDIEMHSYKFVCPSLQSQAMKIQRAWRKLRLVLFWMRFIREKRMLARSK